MEEKIYRTRFHACKAGNFIKLAQKSSWSPNSQRPPKVTDLIALLMSFYSSLLNLTDFSLHTVIEIEKCHQLHFLSPAGDLTWSHLLKGRGGRKTNATSRRVHSPAWYTTAATPLQYLTHHFTNHNQEWDICLTLEAEHIFGKPPWVGIFWKSWSPDMWRVVVVL